MTRPPGVLRVPLEARRRGRAKELPRTAVDMVDSEVDVGWGAKKSEALALRNHQAYVEGLNQRKFASLLFGAGIFKGSRGKASQVSKDGETYFSAFEAFKPSETLETHSCKPDPKDPHGFRLQESVQRKLQPHGNGSRAQRRRPGSGPHVQSDVCRVLRCASYPRGIFVFS
jgi:hypothetical protein